jgi:hypothetical protein
MHDRQRLPLILLPAEFQIPPQISRYASFMFSFIGRGICTSNRPRPMRPENEEGESVGRKSREDTMGLDVLREEDS